MPGSLPGRLLAPGPVSALKVSVGLSEPEPVNLQQNIQTFSLPLGHSQRTQAQITHAVQRAHSDWMIHYLHCQWHQCIFGCPGQECCKGDK